MNRSESALTGDFDSTSRDQQRLRRAWLNRLGRRLLLRRLGALHFGSLTVVDGQDRWTLGPDAASATASKTGIADNYRASIQVHDPRFYGAVVFGGAIGAAEAYIHGWWSADDLVRVIRILVRNREVLDGMEQGSARLAQPLRKLFHYLHRNTRAGSRRNIAAHYDLGNDFYQLFLDPTLMYSCALFESTAQDSIGVQARVDQPPHAQLHGRLDGQLDGQLDWQLERQLNGQLDGDRRLHAASIAKLDLICRKLELRADDEVIEIGTGWGGFAEHAARHYGCRVTTTTISQQQYDFAVARVKEAGLEDRITIVREDYRDLVDRFGAARFDKLVSIEMIEAVGHRYLDTYFATVSQLLRADGMALIQAITMADDQYERYRRSVDFIQRYIFPGSLIPSVAAMSASVARSTDLRLFDLHDITPHYALTLRHWRRRFFDRLDEVRALDFSEDFCRMWDYYLCYCEAGFAERAIGDVQLLLTKPLCRREPLSRRESGRRELLTQGADQ